MSNERIPAIRVIMMPRDTNAFGTIFGGIILSYIDQAGAVEARRTSTQPGTTNSHGQTRTTARIGTDHASTSPAVRPRIRAMTGVEGSGSKPGRSSVGDCTEGG